MEILMLRMGGEFRQMGLILLGCLVILIIEARSLMKNADKLRASKKRSKKALQAAVRKSRTGVIVDSCVLVVAMILAITNLGEYVLDRGESPIAVQGVVTHTGYYKTGRNQPKQFRVILDTGAEQELWLYIHKSLIDDYAIGAGETYAITYYPRTKTLCEAHIIE